MTHLALIDGTGLACRCYFGAGNAKDGMGALCQVFWETLRSPVTHLGIAFDNPGRTFRHDIWPQYKGQRSEKPADLIKLLNDTRRAVDAFGIEVLSWPGHEADDVIASAARAGAKADMTVTIMSVDKDFAQLVNDRITLITRMKGETHRYDRDGVKAKWGVWPEQIPGLLALAGDGVDNIPGVDKIGEKTAAELLARYGSIEAILALPRYGVMDIPRIRKMVEKILDHAEAVRTYLRLATLAIDESFDVGKLLKRGMNRWALGDFLEEFGNTTLLDQVRGAQRG